jgi:hypothetical protein
LRITASGSAATGSRSPERADKKSKLLRTK